MEEFTFELAQHVNKTLGGRTVKEIQLLFANKKLKVTEDGIDMKGLKRKMPEGIPEEFDTSKVTKKTIIEAEEREAEEDEEDNQPKPKHLPLL